MIIYGLFFFLGIFCLAWGKSGIVGLAVLVINFYFQARIVKAWLEKKYAIFIGGLYWVFWLAVYIVSLSFVYYSFGLTRLSIIVWFCALALLTSIKYNLAPAIEISKPLLPLKSFEKWPSAIAIVGSIFLLASFLANPIINGSPTPWVNVPGLTFWLFFVIALCVLFLVMSQAETNAAYWLFSFLIIGVVAAKYVLTFGYDTLLHQAALKHIASVGQITPLTPYYIGQYSLEILANFFTGWPFAVLERFLAPLAFVGLVYSAGRYFSRETGMISQFLIYPAAALLLLPNPFFYTQPFALSLLFGIISFFCLYLYLIRKNKSDYFLAFSFALASVFIHPFVGLNILVTVIGACYFQRAGTRKGRAAVLAGTFLAAATIVTLSFIAFNWLNNKVIFLAHPLYFIDKFFNLFNYPIWYSIDEPGNFWSLVYLYERVYWLIPLVIIVFFLKFRRNLWANIFLLAICLSSFVSAWLFISSTEVSGYSFGDQVNYSYRLLQVAKWLLLPLLAISLDNFFNSLRKLKPSRRYLLMFFLAAILTVDWYLTYPRNDEISRINVNNIRSVDYEAIDLIYEREQGKNGYLVFANQVFGAGAIERYGFGPYLNSRWGEMFYYSVPMGGEMNQRFEKIMNSEKFDVSLINEVLAETKLDKAYLIITDYWPWPNGVEDEARLAADFSWDIDGQVKIFEFNISEASGVISEINK